MGSVPKKRTKNSSLKAYAKRTWLGLQDSAELAYEKKQNVPKKDVLVVHTKTSLRTLTFTMFWRDVSLYLSKPINAQIV